MKKTSKMLALLLALVMVLTACGGGGEDSADTSTDTETSEATSTEESTGGEAETSGEEATSGDEAVSGEETEIAAEDQIEDNTDANTLVVAAIDMNGDYINGFTNSSYDVWAKRLIGTYDGDTGYATFFPDEGGAYTWSDLILKEEPQRTDEEDGSVTYTYSLQEDLVWNDGTPITAKDYLFGQLFINSPQWAALGTTNATSGMELKGFDPYYNGETMVYEGLHLIDDYTFSVTISSDYVPYFYETALVAMTPTPLHRYAPNLDVVETEGGATLQPVEGYEVSEEDQQALLEGQQAAVESAQQAFEDEKVWFEENGYDMAEWDELEPKLDALTPEEYEAAKAEGTLEDGTELGDWTYLYDLKLEITAQEEQLAEYEENPDAMDPTELLLTTSTLEVSQNYRFNPDVTSGPYNFESFENGMVKLVRNENFKGNKDGKVPSIENIILQTVNTQLDVDFVISGYVDLATGVIDGEKIEKAKASPDVVSYMSYPRNGYGYMPMVTDQGSTQYKGVRQAIAFALDRNEFVQTVTGGYGTVVNSAYGLAMWELAEEYDGQMALEYLNENLINYTTNIEAGNEALNNDSPYLYEADGSTEWDPAKAEEAYNTDKENFDYWRYDENGNQLVVYHEGTQDNDVTDIIQTQLPDNTKLMGMEYLINTTDFSTMLTHYYAPDPSDPEAPTVFNLAVGFAVPNDPYFSYHSSQVGAGNTSRVNEEDIDAILEEMRLTDPTETQTWVDGFVEFAMWYNDYMPAVPLYSNEYYDIYNNRIGGENFETSALWDWSQDICDIEIVGE